MDQSLVCDFHSDCPIGEDEGFICGESSTQPIRSIDIYINRYVYRCIDIEIWVIYLYVGIMV